MKKIIITLTTVLLACIIFIYLAFKISSKTINSLTWQVGSDVITIIQLDDGRIASASGDIKIWNIDGSISISFNAPDTAQYSWSQTILQLHDGRIASCSPEDMIVWLSSRTSEENHARLAEARKSSESVRIWNLDGTLNKIVHIPADRISTITQLKDFQIASGATDGTIALWNLNGNINKTLLNDKKDWVNKIIQLLDGRIAASSDETIKIWSLDGTVENTFKNPSGQVITITQLKDGRIASSSFRDNNITIWNLDGTIDKTFKGHSSSILTIIQLRDGKIASGSYDGTVKIWDLDGTVNATLMGHQGWVFSIIQLKDGRLASGSRDGTIKIWDIESKK